MFQFLFSLLQAIRTTDPLWLVGFFLLAVIGTLSAMLIALVRYHRRSCWRFLAKLQQESATQMIEPAPDGALTLPLPEGLPLTPQQVREALEAAQDQWAEVIAYAASSRPQFLLPYLLTSCNKYDYDRTLYRNWFSLEEDEEVASRFSLSLKHWASAQALQLILISPYELKDPTLIDRQFELFTRSLVLQISYDLKRLTNR